METLAFRCCAWLLAAALGAAVSACVQAHGEGDRVVGLRSAVVYGEDGRTELWEAPNEALRLAASTANVALFEAEDVTVTPEGQVVLPGDSAEEQLGVCPDEPFARQPAAARCSGVLVSRNLVLTAAHCARFGCEHIVVVRGFAYEAQDQLRALDRSDIARCVRVLHSEPTWGANGKRSLDYAWLELEGDLDPGEPPRLALEETIAIGSVAAVIGHGQGLPVKIDDGGRVVRLNAPLDGQLRTSIDNFRGGSGAGVFDEAGTLLGIAVNGAYDFEATHEGCLRNRRLEDAEGTEVVTLAARAVDGLCEASPDAELCGSPIGGASCAPRSVGHRSSGTGANASACVALAAWLSRRASNRRTDRRASDD